MAEKKSSKKLQFLLFGLCSLLAMSVCLAVLVVTVRSVEKSNSAVAQYDSQSKTQLDGEKNELVLYLKNLTEKTVDDPFIKCNSFNDIRVDEASVKVFDSEGNENPADRELFIYAKNKLLSGVDGFYGEDFVGEFGKIYQDMPLVSLKEDYITDFSFSVGQADENGNPVYDSNSGELIDPDLYFIKFSIDPAAAESDGYLSELFSLSDRQTVSQKLENELSAVCTVSETGMSVESLEIKATVNRLTDEIISISFLKNYSVKADIDFKDRLSVFGSKKVSFGYTAEKRFEYSYASIRFAQSSVTVEPGGETNLSVNAVIEDDSEYTVTFISSDTQVATVDEMGYVKGIKACQTPVSITVRLDYLGKSFEDTCLVYVGEVESEN